MAKGLIKGMTKQEYKHLWYLQNRERMRARNAQWRKDNPDLVAQYKQDHRDRRRDQGLNTSSGQPLQPVEAQIYIVEAGGRYKIGRSKNLIQREYSLNTNSPFPVNIVYESLMIQGANFVERALHEKYADKRVHGEWFTLNQTNIKHIKTAVNKLNFKTVNHTFTL